MKKGERTAPIIAEQSRDERVKPRLMRRLIWVLAMLCVSTLWDIVAFGQSTIVGMSIACSNDHVYTWYSDRTVSVGTSENLAAYQPPHPYSLPFGKTPDDIVEIGIAGDDHVYTWYRDSTVSSGTSIDLDKYQPRHPYRLSKGKSPRDVVGIDIACSNDHVYVWYQVGGLGFGQRSSGTSDELDKYDDLGKSLSLRKFFLPNSKRPYNIVGMGIAGNDHVYTWYSDGTVSSGTSESLSKYREPYDYVLGPGPCDISADPPKLNGRVVFGVGIRGPSCKASAEMVVRLRAFDAAGNSRLLVEKRLSGTNFELPITHGCTGNGQLTLQTEVQSQGRIVRSSNIAISNCF